MIKLKIIQRKKMLANGEFPICLRYTDRSKVHYITLPIHGKISDWNTQKGEFKRVYKNYKKQNSVLLALLLKGQMIVSSYETESKILTFQKFKDAFLMDSASNKTTIDTYLLARIEDLNRSNKHGTAKTYQDTHRSFTKFTSSVMLFFEDLDFTLLNSYETYLRTNGGTDGGISVKMRCLRALYNQAIHDKIVKREYFPFDTYKISKLKGAPQKRAISIDQIESLKEVSVLKHPKLVNAKHYFMFSYYTAGMNFADMAILKWSDVKDDRVEYIRSKTGQKLSVKITAPVQEVLNYFKMYSLGTIYVFPIMLRDGLTSKQIYNRRLKCRRAFNLDLKSLAVLAGIETNLTTYVIRHSFGTSLYHKGVSFEVISESYGHSNPSITMGYLKDLGITRVDEALERL